MQIESLSISDVRLLKPKIIRDARGFFSETWNERALLDAGLVAHFVQDNHASSSKKGTLRGLHFQFPPKAQDKLVRVTKGAILDVAVDLRRSSQTFGKSVSAVISAENWTQIWVPKGFAHGYVTLAPDTEVLYKVTDYYSPEHEGGIAWDDPALSIDWGVTREGVVVSEKDARLPTLKDSGVAF